MNPPPESTPNDWVPYDEYEDDDEIARSLPEMEEIVDANEVQLHHQDHITTGKVKRRELAPDGRTAGSYHDNPILNSTVYKVEFPDGEVKDYAEN
eukprot:11008203-Ditylum_brightwellii.AAC.1